MCLSERVSNIELGRVVMKKIIVFESDTETCGWLASKFDEEVEKHEDVAIEVEHFTIDEY